MTWKEKLKVSPSRGELDLRLALQTRGLARGMFTDREIVLEITTPDFFWPVEGLVVYLDGEDVHSSESQRLKDEQIKEKLEERGLKVLRFRYRPPLSRKRLNEIVNQIEQALEARRRRT